ncbi:SprT family protein [Virgibacillus xinjiangensis]|uniref:SprT family protein n=1 Tax=Virgibacillus xinjiangensis TaxID=393090 RepID=A0ABV7CSM9_9BACI
MNLLTQKGLHQLVDHLSREYFSKPFLHEVRFNSRLRTTGGRYIPAKKLMELNPKYAEEMDRFELEGIIKHELCHYHLHIEGKGYRHGDPEFKRLLRQTGSPRHCNPLPSQENRHKHIYRCTKCKTEYRRVRRVDVKKYTCGKCKGKLTAVTDGS